MLYVSNVDNIRKCQIWICIQLYIYDIYMYKGIYVFKYICIIIDV